MASDKICCVIGCSEGRDSNSVLHKFPNPKKEAERFKTWTLAIGGANICGVSEEYIYANRRVCRTHFEEKFCCRNNRLSNIAIPTLKLAGLTQIFTTTSEPLVPALTSKGLTPIFTTSSEPLVPALTSKGLTPIFSTLSEPLVPALTSKEHNNLSSHRSDHTYHASSQKVAASIPGNLQNENSTTETDSIDVAIDDEGTDPPEVKDSIDGPFTWQKQAITCADDENMNVVGDEPELIHESKGSQNEQSMLVDLETVVECEEEEQEHGGYRCNECAGDIVGFRYLCVQCADYDVCAACEARGAHAHHYALRVPSRKPRDEVQRVIEAIQKCINDDPSLIFLPADDSVKIEVKNEDEEQPNETECESDPLMVPTVQSLRDEETTRQVPVLEQDPLRSSNVEHADRTARGRLSKNIQDKHFNQQFIFNSSSVPDTGQDYSEVYYLSSLSSDDPESIFSHIEVDDRNCLNDDISNPTNSVEESDGQSTLELFSSTTQETESNVKLKLSNATNYLTKDISDLMCIKSKNLLVKLNRLDMNKLGVFTERRLKNIKNRSTIKR